MKRATRKSSIIPAQCDLQTTTTVSSFSTRFSMPSFIKRVEKLTVDQRSAIQKIGFGNLLRIPNQSLNKTLLAELMYRWSSEKRAFLLEQCAQISISLLDVALILGLRVVGHPVSLNEIEDQPFSYFEQAFGATVPHRKIPISVLETKLDSFHGEVNDDFLRTFLLYMFGVFLFPATNGKVDSRYLSFMTNLDAVPQFAWGAAVLEDLFMWLTKRKDMNVQYVGGCLIFLQVWSFEHIDIARPNLLNGHLTFPRACRWENGKSHQRQQMTAKFKELQDHQILWKLHPSSEELEIDIVKELLEEENQGKELAKPENSVNKPSTINEDGLVVEPIPVEVKSESETDTLHEARRVEQLSLEKPMSQVLGPVAVEVNSEPKMDVVNDGHGVPELNLEQSMASTMPYPCSTNYALDIFDVSMNISTMSQVVDPIAVKVNSEPEMDAVNDAHRAPEPNMEQPMASTTLYPCIPNYAPDIFNEDELRTRDKVLEEELMELKKELQKKTCEIRLLKEQNVELRTRNEVLKEKTMESAKVLEKQSCEIRQLNDQNVELKAEVENFRIMNEELISSSDDLVVRLERILLEGGF